MSKTWQSGGEPVTVTIDCWPEETEVQCQARLDALVAVWMVVYPED